MLRVVMPVHNAGEYLWRALHSVLADLPVDGQVVLVDDGSTDGSEELLAHVARSDPRVHLLRNETPQGVSAALNAGITSPGCPEYVAVAEHDDVVLSGRFAAQLAHLRAHDDCGAVSSTGRYVGPTGRIFGRVAVGPRTDEELEEMVANGRPVLISHPAVTYRRAALDDVGLYDARFDGAQDLDLACRLVYDGGWKVRRLPEIHFHYRLHHSATSFEKAAFQRELTRYIAYRNRATSDGPVLGYEEWRAANPLSARERLTVRRKDLGAVLYRRAGLAWVSRQPAGPRRSCWPRRWSTRPGSGTSFAS